ncbi:MAG: glycosyltransferase family 2 protein [Solirubrobacteraceae bacterium]
MDDSLGRSVNARHDIAIVVLTYNRVHLLERCVRNVLQRTSDATREIIIWDNGSTDRTPEYLRSLRDPRIRVVHHPKNIGQNAYRRAFAMTRSPFMIELDDDMIDAPAEWDLTLLRAFQSLPSVGFLAASLVDNPHDIAAQYQYHIRADQYTRVEEAGHVLLTGPTGGGCAMTSRYVYDLVGGFRENRRYVFWSEDAAYVDDVERAGYRAATLAGLELLHAGGSYYSEQPAEKRVFWNAYRRRKARRRAVKRVLLSVPGVPALNQRLKWFDPPTARRAGAGRGDD